MLSVLDKRYKSTTAKPTNSYVPRNVTTTSKEPWSSNTKLPWKSSAVDTRRLTLAEINEKKSKGLCFHCDEKYIPGHDCKKKKLFLMLDGQQDVKKDGGEDEELAIIWQDEEMNCEEDEPPATISLHAVAGSRGSHNLKVIGTIKNRPISILLDNGSTNNFVSQGLVKQLQLPTSPCTSFKVIIANGEKLMCNRIINALIWRMANQTFNTNLNVIPLGGYDTVLGVEWMETMSPITFDFSQGQITISRNGEKVTLHQEEKAPELRLTPE